MAMFRITGVRAGGCLRVHSEPWKIEFRKPDAAGVITHDRVAPEQIKEFLSGLLPRQIVITIRHALEECCLLLGRELGEIGSFSLARLIVYPTQAIPQWLLDCRSLATMKSMNSLTPASLAPGLSSLGMMISVN
jgi:hypothetical protein